MLERIKNLFVKKQPEMSAEEKVEELFNKTFSVDIIRLEIGSDIAEFGKDICLEIEKYRDKIAESYGFIFPLVHVIQNDDLQENEIKIFIREKEAINEFWIPNSENVLLEINKKLEYIYQECLEDIFSNEFFEKILNTVQQENAWLIWNVTCRYTISDIKSIFVNVLRHKKSIRSAKYIFEKIGDSGLSIPINKLSDIIARDIC